MVPTKKRVRALDRKDGMGVAAKTHMESLDMAGDMSGNILASCG